MDKETRTKIERADLIIEGKISAKEERYVDGANDHLAYLFLWLLKRSGREVLPIDEIRLHEAEDKLDFMAASENVNYGYHELSADWYKSENGEYIARLKHSDEYVLIIKNHRKYIYYDPYEDSEVVVNDGNSDAVEPIVVQIFPSSTATSMLKLCLQAFSLNRKEFLWYLGLIVFPYLIVFLFLAIAGGNSDVSLLLQTNGDLAVMIFAALGAISMIAVSNIMVSRTNARIAGKTRAFIFPVVMGRFLSMKSSNANKVSRDLMSTFLVFVESIDTIVMNVLNAGVYLFYCVIWFIFMNTIKIGVGMTTNITVGIVVLICAGICFKMITITKRKHDMTAKLSAGRKEIIDSTSLMKNYAVEDQFYHRFAILYGEYSDARMSYDKVIAIPSIVLTFVSGLYIFYAFICVFNMGSGGNYSELILMISVLGMLCNYLLGLTNAVGEIINSAADFSFGDTILQKKPESEDGGNCTQKIKGKIEFSNVSFAYSEGGHQILNNVSFTINSGEYVAIVGGSGSGKSTLVRLLLGFEDLQNGEILYDDIPVGQYNLRSLRKQMGVVLQNEGVINGSVKLNIGMEEDPDIDKVKEAARKAAIADEIESWPMKYNTILSSESELISGGQKQRVVIARALFNEPGILVLDEATSAMDNVTQQTVIDNLSQLGCTRIVIAHRLSTIEDCDRIFVLDKGRIVETGTYSELMKKEGLFAKMAKRNLL